MATVVIDPGHGGVYTGAIAADGTKEKDLNLAIGKALQTELQRRGYKVVMTRQGDTAVNQPYCQKWYNITDSEITRDLKCRAGLATEFIEPGIPIVFVSIHHNAGGSSARGTETYYYRSDQNGQKLAQAVQENVLRSLWGSEASKRNRGVKPDDQAGQGKILVLELASKWMPACLVEVLFLSNSEDLAMTKQAAYATTVARGIADGIDQFLGRQVRGTGRSIIMPLFLILGALALVWILGGMA